MDGVRERDFMELQQLPPTNLYYLDIRILIFRCITPLFIPQSGDYVGSEPTVYGNYAGVCRPCDYEDDARELIANPVVAKTRRKTKPSASASLRVWRLHENMNHTALTTLAIMVRQLILRNANCTFDEILLVKDHQDCWACAISKWKKLPKQVTSELTPNIFAAHWSVDIVGPYKVAGIGGYKYEFVFVERSQGYLEVFFGKLKSDLTACIPLLNTKLRGLAWMMESMRVDMGSVENGQEFGVACQQANIDLAQPGIVINPANVGCQEANIVERTIQTYGNTKAAMMISQDLLGSSTWCLLGLAAADTLNNTINVHTGDTCLTPKNHMMRTVGVDASDAFVVGYGKPVIFSRVKRAPSPKLPGVPRNEFGVAVGHGKAHGSVWVLAPGRSNYSIVLRKHVREIRLGVQKQMSMLEGQSYLPVRNDLGEIVLTTRGDSGVLAKQFALDCKEDLGGQLESEDVPISQFSSTIAYNNITEEMTEKYGFASDRAGDESVLEQVLEGGDVLEEEVHINEETGEAAPRWCQSSLPLPLCLRI
jgi:hypothetical protein